ncbi:MAG: hypothetical protein AAGF57_04635 [Pseudomonadota bacterium]
MFEALALRRNSVAIEVLIAKIPRLTSLAEKLLRERKRGREKFFEQVVEPLNAIFFQLVSEHMATFEQLDAMLCDPNMEYLGLVEILDRNALFESGTVNTLKSLAFSRAFTDVPQTGLKESFENYIRVLATCLVVGAGERPKSGPRYYASLNTLLRKKPEGEEEQSSLKAEVRNVVAEFTAYQGEVSQAYHEVKRECLK